VRLADISPNEDTGGSVILRVTSADTTLPRSMIRVSQSFFALLQKNVLNTRRWETRQELRLAIVTWIETKYNRRRRQRGLGKLTPVEFEMIYRTAEAA
jgi:transposase InsO family protein